MLLPHSSFFWLFPVAILHLAVLWMIPVMVIQLAFQIFSTKTTLGFGDVYSLFASFNYTQCFVQEVRCLNLPLSTAVRAFIRYAFLFWRNVIFCWLSPLAAKIIFQAIIRALGGSFPILVFAEEWLVNFAMFAVVIFGLANLFNSPMIQLSNRIVALYF
jgi:hypothetical protein